MSHLLHIVCPHCHTTNRVQSEQLGMSPNCGSCKRALFTGHPVALDDATFDKHISRNDVPVLVDFWASWCGPCRAMAPAYEQAAARLEPYMRVAKVDTEAAPAIAQRFQIRSIPTLMLFVGGREVARQAGALTSPAHIEQWAAANSPRSNTAAAQKEKRPVGRLTINACGTAAAAARRRFSPASAGT